MAIRILQALWNAVKIAQDQMFYWRNYPGVHAPDEPWTSNRQAVRQVISDMPQDEFDTLYNACFNARSQYHVERTSDIGEYVFRCLGGHITITEQHVDMILLQPTPVCRPARLTQAWPSSRLASKRSSTLSQTRRRRASGCWPHRPTLSSLLCSQK